MPAHCNIHYTSPDRGIDALITRLSSDLVQDPLHTYLIVPTKQLVNSIQKKLDEKAIPYVPDQIATISGFCIDHTLHDMTGVYVLDSAEAMAILGVLFGKHRDSFPLLRVYNKSSHIEKLFRFFGELTKHAVPFPECFHVVHKSQKIKELGDLYELYHNYLRDHHYVDEYVLIEHTRKTIIHNQKQQGIFYFFGFYDLELSVLERDLIQVICEYARKIDYTIPYGFDDTIFNTHELPPYLLGKSCSISEPDHGKNSSFTNIFSISVQTKSPHQVQTPIYSTIVEDTKEREKEYIENCATKTEEITLIAKEITRLCAEEDLYDDITVAFPNVKDVLLFFDMIFGEYQIPFYTSQEYRFSSHPFSQFCMDALSLIEQDLSYEKIFPVVMSPYFGYEKLSGKCLDLLMRWAHLERIPNDLAPVLERIETGEKEKSLPFPKKVILKTLGAYQDLEKKIKALQGKKAAKEHAKSIIAFLESIVNVKHLNDGNLRIERIYSQFQKYVHNSAMFIHASESNITLEQYCTYARHYLEQVAFPGPANRSGVRVLSLGELAYETCQYLFLAGLNEGDIPLLINTHPFTTREETKVLGILKQADIVKIEQYYFISALCAGKKAVYLSARNDESKSLIESPFFDQVLFNCHISEWPQVHENKGGFETTPDLALRIEIEQRYRTGIVRSEYDGIISNAPCIDQYLSAHFGSDAGWSATKLETYAHCPFRFWIERVLHVRPLEDPRQKISFTEHGTRVHQILCDLYETLQERGLLSLTHAQTEEITSTLDELTSAYLSEQNSWLPETAAQIGTLIGTRYTGEGSLKRFIRSEIECQEKIPLLMPTYFEFAFGGEAHERDDGMTTTVDLKDVDDEDSMLLEGAIDRIDHIGEHYFGIIDYKTGTVSKMDDIVNGLSLQLPLYMHAYRVLSGRTGIYGSLLQFKQNNIVNTTLLYDKSAEAYIPYSLPRKEILSDEIIQNIVIEARKHIRDIRKGLFPITAREKCPDTWCPYSSICRYSRSRGSESREYTRYAGGEHANI